MNWDDTDVLVLYGAVDRVYTQSLIYEFLLNIGWTRREKYKKKKEKVLTGRGRVVN